MHFKDIVRCMMPTFVIALRLGCNLLEMIEMGCAKSDFLGDAA
jgi:hypothetical protein